MSYGNHIWVEWKQNEDTVYILRNITGNNMHPFHVPYFKINT